MSGWPWWLTLVLGATLSLDVGAHIMHRQFGWWQVVGAVLAVLNLLISAADYRDVLRRRRAGICCDAGETRG
jgi:hypothetical protein